MDIKQHIQEAIKNALSEMRLQLDDMASVELSVPKQKDHGDLASNIVLALASQLKQNPRMLAQDLVKHLHLDSDLVRKVEIAGPGFINFTLNNQFIYDGLLEILKKQDEYGKSDWGEQKRTQVEFVSANPTGPLTIGHGRQAVLGDTIARLLEASGHDVVREYYFNDAGRQMRVLGDSVRLRYLEISGEPIDFPEDYYQGEYIREIARQAYNDKGESLKLSDEEGCYFRDLAETVIFQDIKTTLERMNIRFDLFYNEKSLYETGKIDAVVKALRDRNLAYDLDGAVWLKATELGLEQDRVIIKSTGEPTYRLPDIAYHKDKMDRGFDLVIDIFGADHIATYPDVLAGIQALGYDPGKIKVLIHQFVTLTEGKEKIKMSTRKANFVTLDELIDEVGTDVVRYFFLNRSMSSHLNFDLSLAKTQSDENPVYYVQYAHARICSILRHAEEQGYNTNDSGDAKLLKSEEELDLIKALLDFPRVIADAARQFEPQRITTYLESLATFYHRFQHTGKVDDSMRVVTKNKDITQARLMLCQATKIVLANGLTVLGISKPEKM